MVGEGQDKLRVLPQVFHCPHFEQERLLQELKAVLQAEIRFFCDDAPHAVLEHLCIAVPYFCEGVDQPNPLLAGANVPLDAGEHLRRDVSIDHKVAQVGNSHSYILVYQFKQTL